MDSTTRKKRLLNLMEKVIIAFFGMTVIGLVGLAFAILANDGPMFKACGVVCMTGLSLTIVAHGYSNSLIER